MEWEKHSLDLRCEVMAVAASLFLLSVAEHEYGDGLHMNPGESELPTALASLSTLAIVLAADPVDTPR
jgi:hypothetical protein